MRDVGRCLRDDHPFSLLALASTLLAVFDPRDRDPFDRRLGRRPRVDGEEFVASLLDVRRRETSALLAAIAAMSPDEVLTARIRRELDRRDDHLPRWVMALAAAKAEAYRTVEMVHILGDGDNVMVALRLPSGHELSVVVYVDHNLGTLVKDAFVVPEPLDGLVEFMREKSGDDPDTAWDDIDPADARARITAAIELAAMTVPTFETDTWPACRPLVEWAARLLPEGGRGYTRPQWDGTDLDALTVRFLTSPFVTHDDEDHPDLLELVLRFATDYGPGDPLRWSPVAVEILLADWFPRKVVADAGYLAKLPDLLRAFVRFCHAERGVRRALTEETLAAIDRFEPEYQHTIRSPRPQGPNALLAALGLVSHDAPPDYRHLMLDTLRRAVGGERALDRLDAESLPDEPFSWDKIPADIHTAVAEVLALCDRCCDEMLDIEFRTACRRVLARVASRGPDVFRRRVKAETSAAAVCWIVGKANDLFSPSGRGMLVRDLMGHFGLASASQRAKALLRAGGFPTDHYAGIDLGSPEFLVSNRRRRILQQRDRYRALLAEG